MNIDTLIAVLAKKHKEKFGTPPNKTKLIKLAYLAEVYFKSNTSARLTDQEWIYWKYGPYIHGYDSIVENPSIFIPSDEQADFIPINVCDDYEHPDISLDENIAILTALEHAASSLNEILDFVYFDTEPMIKARNRGESLDFESVLPHSFYAIKKYRVSEKMRKEILKRIREWEARRIHAS